MCIIVYKKSGSKMPSEETLRLCFSNNPHGAGYMYRLPDNQIRIKKGYTDIEKLLISLKKDITIKVETAIHFRIATHGKICPENSHPFPITSNRERLHELDLVCNRALVHNGILHGYSSTDGDISDSGFFAKMLYPCTTDAQYMAVLNRHNDGSKFVVMTSSGTYLSGEFYNDHGVKYSNEYYKPFTQYSLPDNHIPAFRQYDKHKPAYRGRYYAGEDIDILTKEEIKEMQDRQSFFEYLG